MPNPPRLPLLAALAALLSLSPAMAETLRCRSVNGNITCAGSGGVSCQTVNGRTTCVSGGGAVVQQFGGAPAPERSAIPPAEAEEDQDDSAWREEAAPSQRHGRNLSIERRGPGGSLSLEREGARLRLRTERLAIDLD